MRRIGIEVLACAALLGLPGIARAGEPATPAAATAPATGTTGTEAPPAPATGASTPPASPRWPGPRTGLRDIAWVDLQGAYNPLGIQVIGGIQRRHVYEVDTQRNIEWAYLQAGIGGMISPAIAQASVHLEWMPAAVFTLRFQADVIGYFGTMGALRQFDARPSRWDVDRKDGLAGHDRTGVAFRTLIQPTLALQVSRVILRSQCNLAMYGFTGNGQYFYDYENDSLMARTELLVFNPTYLLIEAWKARRDALLYVGALYDVTYAAVSGVRRQRVGGVIVWQPKDPWGPLDRMRIYVMGGYILEDENRQGEPFLAGGIGTDFDL